MKTILNQDIECGKPRKSYPRVHIYKILDTRMWFLRLSLHVVMNAIYCDVILYILSSLQKGLS